MNVASVVQILAIVSWMIVIGAIVFLGVTIARGGKAGALVPLVVGALVLALVLNVTAAGLIFVPPEQRAVVESALQGGVRPAPLGAGLHWITPVFERPIFYPISRRTYTMTSSPQEGQVVGDDSIQARTKDGQEVSIDASVIYEVDPAKVVQLHITWQDRYEDGVVRTVTRSAIRDAVSQYGVEEIVSSKRAELQQAITEQVADGLSKNNLELVDFLLRNIAFSEEYAKAVEQKQIAEQLAQQAAFTVQQRKQEAEQARQVAEGLADAAVIKAKGDAEARLVQADAEAKALALIAAALKDNPDLIQYTYVQKLGSNVQVMLVPSNSPYLFNLPQVPAATAITEPTGPEPVPTTAP